MRKLRKCIVCGEPIPKNRRRFCSKKCVDIFCAIVWKEFQNSRDKDKTAALTLHDKDNLTLAGVKALVFNDFRFNAKDASIQDWNHGIIRPNIKEHLKKMNIK